MAAKYVVHDRSRQLHSVNKKGFVYLLRPSPELWTISLPHRTQILYAPDMAFVAMKLNLSPGACVVEAGTGSGSFTHFLARTVGRGPPASNGAGQTHAAWPTQRAPSEVPRHRTDAPYDGRVYSFEFHAERVEKARAEFTAHGLDTTVVLHHRNVCKAGFGLTHEADAVFLDLPAPWEAVTFAKDALRRDVMTRICCFSPCIEQVLRTVTALSDAGYTDIATYESLVRTHESLTNVAPLESIGDVVARIRQTEAKRESRRTIQMAQSKLERERRQAEKAAAEGASTVDATGPVSDSHSHKRKAEEDTGEAPAKKPAKADTDIDVASRPHETDPPAEMLYSQGFRQKVERRSVMLANVYSRPFPQMRGHTSYLTFATLLPRSM